MSFFNRMVKLISSLAVCVLLLSTVMAQGIDTRGRISNSVYAYGENDSTNVRLYQYLRFTADAKEWNNLSLNVAARVLTDTREDLPDETRFNAFRLSLSAKNLFNNLLDFELGRQFFHPGVVLGSLDGLNLRFRFSNQFSWQIYGGVESHLYKAMKIYKADDATVYGTTFNYYNLYQTNFQLAFLEKKTSEATQWRITGLNISSQALDHFRFQTQLHYDLLNKRMHRVYVMGKFLPNQKMNYVVSFKLQHPQVYGDSYFQIFNFKNYRQFTAGGWYEFYKDYALSLTYNLIQLQEGDGHRIIFALNDKNGSIGVVSETGDLGNQTSFMLDYGLEVVRNLVASVSVDYTKYRFEERFDWEDQMANAARLAYNIGRHWRIDLEYQWLNNKFKSSDQRLLNHIHFIW